MRRECHDASTHMEVREILNCATLLNINIVLFGYTNLVHSFFRLIQHMRQNSISLDGFLGAVQAADKFITMLHDLSSMGAAMRVVMTHALTNPQVSCAQFVKFMTFGRKILLLLTVVFFHLYRCTKV